MKKEEIKLECGLFIEQSNNTIAAISNNAKLKVEEILREHYDVFHWDFNNGDAPSIMSYRFGDEPTDCYITRLYADRNNIIRIDLYAYYIGEEKIAVSVDSEPEINYLDLLEYIIAKLG